LKLKKKIIVHNQSASSNIQSNSYSGMTLSNNEETKEGPNYNIPKILGKRSTNSLMNRVINDDSRLRMIESKDKRVHLVLVRESPLKQLLR
jgi:hypothetical protein